MKFGFIAKHRSIWPVAWLCEALGVSRSGFHAWLHRGPSARTIADEDLTTKVRASFIGSARTYGARRVWHDGRGRLLWPAQGRTADAGERLACAPASPWPAERRGRTFDLGRGAEHARPAVCCRSAEPQMDCRLQCAAASGVRDGGRSPAIGLQERVANHRKRRWSKARVVSVTEKALQRRQVGDRKANTREPPYKCRKLSDDVETGE